jgi:hypothetical protein
MYKFLSLGFAAAVFNGGLELEIEFGTHNGLP